MNAASTGRMTELSGNCKRLVSPETIQCAAWNICCARPRGPKRVISGSAASARSSPRCSDTAIAGSPTRACSTAAAAPARTSSCSTLRPRLRLRSVCGRPAIWPRGRPHAAGARDGHRRALPERRLRPRHVVRRPVFARRPDERAAIAEMFRLTRPGGYALINVAAMDVLRGDHSVLSREVRRYSRARSAAAGQRRRLHDRAPHLHERRALPAARRDCAWCSAGAASQPKSRRSTRSRSRRRRSTRC